MFGIITITYYGVELAIMDVMVCMSMPIHGTENQVQYLEALIANALGQLFLRGFIM